MPESEILNDRMMNVVNLTKFKKYTIDEIINYQTTRCTFDEMWISQIALKYIDKLEQLEREIISSLEVFK